MWEKPKTLDDAKKVVAGSAGVEFEKYPLKFAVPTYFGARPQPGIPAAVNSGTASLVRLGGQPFALTCSHVLEAYRERLAEGICIFQIGACELDSLAQLKVEDSKLDYALIAVTDRQGTEVTRPGVCSTADSSASRRMGHPVMYRRATSRLLWLPWRATSTCVVR